MKQIKIPNVKRNITRLLKEHTTFLVEHEGNTIELFISFEHRAPEIKRELIEYVKAIKS